LVIDFEDTCHSYLPAMVDLAVTVLRFCLVHAPEKKELGTWIRAMGKAYSPETPLVLEEEWPQVIRIIQHWCSHCILLQLGLDLNRAGCDPGELKKFDTYYSIAETYQDL
jgi:hypothetical protein